MDDEDDEKNNEPSNNDFSDQPSQTGHQDIKLYSWGRNRCGIDSKQQDKNYFSVDPEPLYLNLITQIKQIACGASHALIVDQRGLLYSLGSNEFGQLGINNLEVQTNSEP